MANSTITVEEDTFVGGSATAGVGFTINHIAAVILPAVLGFLWLISPSAVFLVGSALAVLSMLLSFNVPENPSQGNEVVHGHWGSTRQSSQGIARQS